MEEWGARKTLSSAYCILPFILFVILSSVKFIKVLDGIKFLSEKQQWKLNTQIKQIQEK